MKAVQRPSRKTKLAGVSPATMPQKTHPSTPAITAPGPSPLLGSVRVAEDYPTVLLPAPRRSALTTDAAPKQAVQASTMAAPEATSKK